MSGPEADALAELIADKGARWQIEWGTLTGVGRPLLADPRPGYRRARGTPTIVAYTVAEMRRKIEEVDAEHACDL